MRVRVALLVVVASAGCGPARVEIDPPTVQLFGRGQKATVHAVPMSKGNSPMPQEACRWTSSDDKVAAVTSRHNEATIAAAGPGRAVVKCAVGSASAEVPVAVTVVSRVEVQPRTIALRVEDEPRPTPLTVRAFDGDGRELQGRPAVARCLDEDVCRGDGRGQLWPVGAGDTKAIVRVDDAEGDAAVHVADARTAAGKPRRVSGNPMEHIGDEPARRAR